MSYLALLCIYLILLGCVYPFCTWSKEKMEFVFPFDLFFNEYWRRSFDFTGKTKRKDFWLVIVQAFLFYFLGGYLLYSSIFAAIGAAVDNQTDAQQFLMPITIVLIVALYAGILTVPEDPNGIVAQIFSFIPLTSPIVMMMRIPHGVPIFEQIISITILFLSVILIIWIAAKIYRIGILMYGKKPSYKELIKWLKY